MTKLEPNSDQVGAQGAPKATQGGTQGAQRAPQDTPGGPNGAQRGYLRRPRKRVFTKT